MISIRTQERLNACNRILASFSKQRVLFSISETGRVMVSWHSPKTGKKISKMWTCKHGYPTWRKSTPWGDNQSRAMYQLIRWYRGLPVMPMETWEYWASDTIKLCNAETLAILREVGWPEQAQCVLCGQTCKGLDWWEQDEVTGPCCSGFRRDGCRQIQLAA